MTVYQAIYDKQSTQKGIMYLHGWGLGKREQGSEYEYPVAERPWLNICLKHYDIKLPELQKGDVIWFEADYQGNSSIFTTVMLKRLFSWWNEETGYHHHELWAP